ncbi:MAG: RNA polymerase sigma factor [Actinomycetota bacterium]|nr:RNA polymerase sigma factor [Actinomycetota bacterium]MDH5225037.1 RNA polymerase sigma factor [Actinomycetota bacterium]MDH5314159.1 RNA polymerase sigma factor [Actinomycetota bacterium]
MNHLATADAGAVERVFREAYGEAVATLIRTVGDITLAEDAVQEAFVVATDRWPTDGIPANPAGWIVTTAKRRAIDVIRRSARGRHLQEEAGIATVAGLDRSPVDEPGPVRDDRLRLIFTCCHPSLRREHHVALTLRLLGGLSVEEVARLFFVSEAAMAKRLVRAKYKIKAAKIPYRVPEEADLPARLRSVLSVLSLIYTSGLDGEAGEPLRTEAIRLTRELVDLLPDEPEAAGLLALLLLSESRAPARCVDGDLVLLQDQDRTAWDREMIAEGHAIVRACIRRGRPGPYQLQAAIQAVHAAAATFEATDWPQIVALYDQLLALSPTPVVALNRAIALAEVLGPAEGLAAVDAIPPGLETSHLLHAARGTMLRELERPDDALAAFERAVQLATSDPDRRFLTGQIDALAVDRR